MRYLAPKKNQDRVPKYSITLRVMHGDADAYTEEKFTYKSEAACIAAVDAFNKIGDFQNNGNVRSRRELMRDLPELESYIEDIPVNVCWDAYLAVVDTIRIYKDGIEMEIVEDENRGS